MFQREKPKFLLTTQNLIANHTGNGDVMDYGNVLSEYITIESITEGWNNSSSSAAAVKVVKKKEDERKDIEPIQVFAEMKKETPDISFADLEPKIKAVKERMSILEQHLSPEHLKDEMRTLWYLENRLKYLKTRKKNPIDWAMTTRPAIEDLCKRYKLKTVPLKQYYTLVPKEGLAELERYTKAYAAVTGDNPIFELVIKDKPEETRKKDRDPILLANSPLGNFMMILGAWDDEVEIVDEIIYGMK